MTHNEKLSRRADKIRLGVVAEPVLGEPLTFPVSDAVDTPWFGHNDGLPEFLEYRNCTMYDAVADTAKKYPNNIAFDFMGHSTTYRQLIENINRCARSLRTIGVREDDRVTIAMPNCPQAIYMFYAVNLVGAVGNMIHPLSAEKEIENYLIMSHSPRW
ncbi:MAG: AMP-binding protein [Eggerthellaceae bacterium]|nr:AMP-binding protein [Eggerthellaceae bacterium]